MIAAPSSAEAAAASPMPPSRAGKLAQMCEKACDGERERAGGPVVLAREANRNGRQLPEVELLAPVRHDLAREPFRDHDIGVEREMRTVLLDRAERQAQD